MCANEGGLVASIVEEEVDTLHLVCGARHKFDHAQAAQRPNHLVGWGRECVSTASEFV